MEKIAQKLASLAAHLDAQGDHAEADAVTGILRKVAKRSALAAASLESTKEKISEEFLGLYTIHGIAVSRPKKQITVYADEPGAIPRKDKARIEKMADPFTVVFKASEEPDADKALRLDEKI